MHLEVPHNMNKEKAAQHIKNTLNAHRGELAEHATVKKEEWEDSTLNFEVDLQGKSITGTLEVTDTTYVVDATLPLLWRMFEGRIEAEVRKQVEQMSKQ